MSRLKEFFYEGPPGRVYPAVLFSFYAFAAALTVLIHTFEPISLSVSQLCGVAALISLAAMFLMLGVGGKRAWHRGVDDACTNKDAPWAGGIFILSGLALICLYGAGMFLKKAESSGSDGSEMSAGSEMLTTASTSASSSGFAMGGELIALVIGVMALATIALAVVYRNRNTDTAKAVVMPTADSSVAPMGQEEELKKSPVVAMSPAGRAACQQSNGGPSEGLAIRTANARELPRLA